MSISQGIALTHLLSAKGQRDIVHDHHHPLQGHRPLRACLLPALYPHHHQPRWCTHLWSTWQGSITASVLTACATQKAQESSAPGTVWQGEVAETRTKAKPGELLAKGAF